MDNNNDLLYWKLGQMNAAKGYAAAAKGKPSGGTDWSSYWATRTPSALILTVLSDTSVQLDWTNGATEDYDGLRIYSSTDGTAFTELDTAGATDETFTAIGLTVGTQYWFYVKAYKGVEESTATSTVIYYHEISTYITGLATALSSGQATRLNTFVGSVKTGMSITDLDDAFDFMYVLAGETAESSLKNIAKNAHHALNVNSTTFNALEGFTGNGNNMRLNPQYNPATDTSKATLNSMSLGVYLRTDANGALCDMGVAQSAPANFLYIYSRLTDKFYYTNNTLNANQDVANTDSRGLFISSRTANNLTTAYINGTPVDTDTTLSEALPNNGMAILARKVGSGWDGYTSRQTSFAFIGKGLSSSEVTVLTNAFEAYMDASGKGVINP